MNFSAPAGGRRHRLGLVGGADLGRWFDAASNALILDQRSLWLVLLSALVFLGAGPLSADRLLSKDRA